MTWSLPHTCFSCQHYRQVGYKKDELAVPRKDKWGVEPPIKKQRYGLCSKKGCHVFWDERPCPVYLAEKNITTHSCPCREKALQPHQDQLI